MPRGLGVCEPIARPSQPFPDPLILASCGGTVFVPVGVGVHRGRSLEALEAET